MRHRRDNNHSEIAGWLRDLHFSVQDTSQMGDSFPDLVIAKYGINALVEIKGKNGKLSPGQLEFKKSWRGFVVVVRTQDDCILLDRKFYELAHGKR